MRHCLHRKAHCGLNTAPSAVSATALATRMKDCINSNHTNDEDELHNDKDRDKVLQLIDMLTKIMV